MLKKLLHGFIYGIGFSLAVLLAAWGFTTYQLSTTNKTKSLAHHDKEISYEERAKWRELPISEKIPKLTGVVLLRFKEEDNNFMAAYVESIFTKDSSVKLPLNIGDRVDKSDYYAKGGHFRNRDGILLMFVGNQPKIVEETYLYDSRLVTDGDMPLELFLKKFKEIK